MFEDIPQSPVWVAPSPWVFPQAPPGPVQHSEVISDDSLKLKISENKWLVEKLRTYANPACLLADSSSRMQLCFASWSLTETSFRLFSFSWSFSWSMETLTRNIKYICVLVTTWTQTGVLLYTKSFKIKTNLFLLHMAFTLELHFKILKLCKAFSYCRICKWNNDKMFHIVVSNTEYA